MIETCSLNGRTGDAGRKCGPGTHGSEYQKLLQQALHDTHSVNRLTVQQEANAAQCTDGAITQRSYGHGPLSVLP